MLKTRNTRALDTEANATSTADRNRLYKHLESYSLPVILVAAFIGFSAGLPGTFPTSGNLLALLQAQAVYMLLATGLSLPVRSGDFDLSVAATMSFCAAVAAVLMVEHHTAWWLAVIAAVLLGAAIGAVNGFLVVVLGIDSFIATLGTMTALGGLTYGITGSNTISGLPTAFTSLAQHSLLDIPAPVFLGWVVAAIFWYMYRYTPWGRYTLFIGGNRDTSKLVGIRVSKIRVLAFCSAGFVAAVAGITLLGTLSAADPTVGPQYLLPPFAALFLGATTIEVGRINILGTVVALYLLAVVVTGLELLGAPSWIGDLFNGLALLIAVAFARLANKISLRNLAASRP